jgi:SPP1 gp7 family putative phage head morphogenesis protein
MPGWAISADPAKFDEAIAWLSQRVVITAETAALLDDDSRQRAFWVGGGLQLAQIQNVFDEIAKAVESGEPFEQWRKRLRSTLRNDAHAETVFRNATQRALNAGRYRQMKDPAVIKYRPFFMFDAVLDTRTTTVCKKLGEPAVIRPADDPFWETRWPPLHHRCRSGVRSLRKAEAERRGITNVPPIDQPPPGWGNTPDKAPIWKPDPKKHDPKLVAELEKKKAKADSKKPPPPPKNKPEHDPKFWEKDYAHLGEAAPCAAWGRAMLERGLDRSVAEFRAEYDRLKAAGHPALTTDISAWLKGLRPNQPLRGTVVGNQLHALIAFTEHTRTISPAAQFVAASGGSGAHLRVLAEAERFYQLTLDKSVKFPTGIHVDIGPRGAKGEPFRAKASWNKPRDDGSIGPRVVIDRAEFSPVVVHELAHLVEFSDPRAVARSRAFLLARTKGEPLKKLRDLTGIADYRDNEVAWEDKFWSPYVGKEYGAAATEVTSMGYERIMDSLTWFVRGSHRQADEEALFFMLGQLAGR